MARRKKIRPEDRVDGPAQVGDYVRFDDRGTRGGYVAHVHNGRKHHYVVVEPMTIRIGTRKHEVRPQKKVELRAIREIYRR
mgnify:CR=1 FL=1